MRLSKEHAALFILCAAAGLLWAQTAGLFGRRAGGPARPGAQRFEFPPSADQTRREPVPSGFQRPLEPATAGAPRSTLSVRELRIVDAGGNVVLRAGVSASGSGIWMGRPGAAAEIEAGVDTGGAPFFQLYAEGRPGVAWSGVDTASTASLHLRGGQGQELGVGMAPTAQTERPFVFHTDSSGQKLQFLNP